MSLRHAEGFEVRQSDFYNNRLYESAVGTYVNGGVGGRKGGSSITATNYTLRTKSLVASPTRVWFQQLGMRKPDNNTWAGGNEPGIFFRNDDGEQCSLVAVNGTITGNFKWELRRGATVIDTSIDYAWGGQLAWNVFILRVDVGDPASANGSYELKAYDRLGVGTTVFSGVSVDLTNQTSAGVNRAEIKFGTLAGVNLRLDDWLVWDNVNSPVGTIFADAFPSQPFQIFGAQPTANGNQNDWIPNTGANWTRVTDNRTASSGDDPSRVTSEVVTDVDLYNYADFTQDLAPTGLVVRAMLVDSMVAMTNSGTRTIQVRVRSGVSEADEGTGMVVTDLTLRSDMRIMEQNPVTVAAWTRAELDPVQVGVRLAS